MTDEAEYERARLFAEIVDEWSGDPEELSPEEQETVKRALRAATAPPLTDEQRNRLRPIIGGE